MNRGYKVSVRQIVIFKLGNEEYGIDIMKVVEIVLHQEIRQVPDAPSYIEGIINLRGDIHPIYNLRTRFNMPQKEADENTKIIVIRTTEMNVGFIVDGVSEILNIPMENIQDAPNIIRSRADEKYIQGVAKEENRMIVLLDIDQLVSDQDYGVMNRIVEE